MATSSKRERELARAHYERQQARRAQVGSKARRRNQVVAAVVAVLLVVGGIVGVALLNDDDDSTVTANPETVTSTDPTPETSATPSAAPAAGECAYTPTAGEQAARDVGVPTYDEATAKQPYTATLKTSEGDIVFEANAAAAPCTANSFKFLAEKKYYDDTTCHRLVTEGIFVLQCGDPAGTGSGGPGYGFGIENAPEGGQFPAGTVAMARSSDPNSNGSQFFIVYDDTTLPTDGGGYTIFGQVTKGLDIVKKVAEAGVDPEAPAESPEKPATPVDIQTVTIAPKAE